MKHYLLFISLVSFTLAKSQAVRNAGTVGDFMHTSHLKWNYPWLETLVSDKKLKDISFTETVKGKDTEAFRFNEKGLIVTSVYKHYYDNSFLTNTSDKHEYTYDTSDKLVQVNHFNKKDKLVYSQSWTYYSPKQFRTAQKSRKGKSTEEVLYSYNQDSTLAKTEFFYFKKAGKTPRFYYLYSYYEDKKPKTTTFYRKNKLKHTWAYSCDERGKMEKKDTTSICTSEGYDSKGRKIVTQFNRGDKKHITKTVYYYQQVNNKDVLSEYQHYVIIKGKERILYTLHEPDSLEPFRSFKIYDRKGRLKHQDITNYSVCTSDRKIIKNKDWTYFNKKGKISTARLETYTDNGLPLKAVILKGQNKEASRMEYVFTSDSEFTINHYRQSRLKKSFKASVSYY